MHSRSAAATAGSATKTGIVGALTTNMLNMIGVGPFLSIPLALSAVHGSGVLCAWLLGALISLGDGLVWAELGSAMPHSGGPYVYLRTAFNSESYGQLMGFLVLWTTVVTAPLLIASGAVGFAQYSRFLLPQLHGAGTIAVAAGVCLVNVALLYRDIKTIGVMATVLWVMVVGVILWIVAVGARHIPTALLSQWSSASQMTHGLFWKGMGAATLIAVYDYAGYYNVCLIGGELRKPSRTIPYAIIGSLAIVTVLYVTMNLAIIGSLPFSVSSQSSALVATYMQTLAGTGAATLADVLVLIAAFASVFAILLGFSRIPYVAAQEGEFFSIFACVHPRKNFPHVSLLVLGVCSAAACFLSLDRLIELVIVIQAITQFIAQCVAVVVLRGRNSYARGTGFRMPLYPLPVCVAMVGWLAIVYTSGATNIAIAFCFLVLGITAFLIKARQQHHWPFQTI